ncbi:Putative adhesin [Ruminococcus sp. YRD2003]|uniref:DUF4097 family beta strand repeat-containing protein n=1 Tax=Ruminococcus sp. YRD2003 TaxID=1452313 RepID=UPI0008AA986A|nr:Putative adhesin [Ruminococcus flavefaciens]
MKTSAKIMTALTAASMIFPLTSCVLSYNASVYDHADSYSAGDFETTTAITALDIDWSAGNVDVSYHDKDTVTVTETCNVELKEAQQVHTWLDGSTLHIRYCKSGTNFSLDNAEKKLEVKLPKNTELKDLRYDGSSAGSHFDGIYAENFSIDTSSGAAQLDSCSADIFDIDSSSGNIYFTQTGESDKITIDTSSGNINLEAEKVGEVSTNCSSGKAELDVKSAEKISTDSSSGDVKLRLGAMPSETIMDASSGDITLWLPKDADFTADIDTASGSFDSDIPFTKKDDTYVCGSGTNKVSIDTASGDVTIKTEE